MIHKDSFSDIRQKSARGIKWQISTEILARLIQLIITFVLARLLLPSDFGLIGMAFIFTQLAFVLFDLGLSSALIQKKDVQKIHFQTVNSVFTATALFFYITVYFLAPWIGMFFHQPQLVKVLRWLGIVFFFYGLRATPTVQLTRAMRFKALGLIRLFSVFVYGGIAVGLAWQKFGVWSFVFGIIGQEATLTLLMIFIVGKLILPHWDSEKLKELTGFGSQVLGSRIMGYLNVNLPNIIIGRWMGPSMLGYYSVGYQLVDFPVQRISKNILRVMFPAFSRLQDDRPKYQQLYRDTVTGLLLVVFPVFAGMALVAPEFVSLFYGAKWRMLIPVLQILTIVGLARSVWVMASVIFLSKGKPKWELLINVVYFVVLSAALLVVYSHGLLTVVTTISFLIFIFVIIAVVISSRLIRLPLADWMRMIKTPAIGTLSLSGTLLFLRFAGINNWPTLVRFILLIAIGSVVYLGTVYLSDRQALRRFKAIVGKS